MNRKIRSYFEIAAKLAASKSDRRVYLLGAVGIRRDGAMVASFNGPATQQSPRSHAEARLCQKLDFGAPAVFVARVRVCDGTFGPAKPCARCEKKLSQKQIRKVYYTISDNEYGVLEF